MNKIVYTGGNLMSFWSKVNIKDRNSCWEWMASCHKFGYGWFRITGKTYLAHRLALIFTTGEMGKLQVLHSCDNPKCCNPNHLRWGTQKENIQDCIKRGRKKDPPRNESKPPVYYGKDNNNAKLDAEKVDRIRHLYVCSLMSGDELAKQFGVSRSTIYQIINYKTWKHPSLGRNGGLL